MRKVGLLIALLGFGAACDEDDPARHLDGGLTPDTQQIDAPLTPQPVTVTVKSAGVGQQGVLVHFQNADSSLVATEMTDATGTASHVMNAGGYVTAIDPFPPLPSGLSPGPTHVVRTFAGVKPGDHLRLEDSGFGSGSVMTMTLPPQTDGNITGYNIKTTCGSSFLSGTGSGGSNPSGSVYFNGCTSGDILVIAMNNSTPLSYFFVANETVTDQGTLDYSAKSFSGLATRTYSLGALPANVTGMSVDQHVGTTKGELDSFTGLGSGDPVTATVTFPNIANGIGGVQVNAGTASMQHIGFDWGGLSTTAFSTDFGARMLTEGTNMAFDPATHTVTWTETAAVAPDFAAVDMFGQRTSATDYQNIEWRIVAPYTAGTVTLPTLPTGTFDLNYMTSDFPEVQLLGFGKMPGGYDTIRSLFFVAESPLDITTGPTGSSQFAFAFSGGQALRTPFARTAQPTAPKKTVLLHRTQSTH